MDYITSKLKSAFTLMTRVPPAELKLKSDAYTILLFGETGSGKSTLVNYLVNFFQGADLDELKIAIPNQYHAATEGYRSTEKSMQNRMQSQTGACTTYELAFGEIKFKFIDTPGLSDTKGTSQDDINLKLILRAAEEAGKLAAVVIVINGTVARATVNLRSALTRMRGSIPDAILKNLIVVMTNCSESTYNFDIRSLKPWKLARKNVFFMNNSALSQDPKKWRKTPRTTQMMENQWKDSMEVIEQLIERITEFGHAGTSAFKTMREQRDKIKSELHGILLEVKKLQAVQDELDSAEAAEKSEDADIQKYLNFKQEKTVDYMDREPAAYHSTFCMTHANAPCHEMCGLSMTETIGDAIFMGCWCMKGASCHICGCGHESHYHAKVKLVSKQKTVEDILQDVKANFDLHTARHGDLKKKIFTLQHDLTMLKKALREKEKLIKHCCVKIKKICSNFNFVSELKSVIDAMKANARTLTSSNVRNDADDMISNIQHLVDRLTDGGEELDSEDEEPRKKGSRKMRGKKGKKVDEEESSVSEESESQDSEKDEEEEENVDDSDEEKWEDS